MGERILFEDRAKFVLGLKNIYIGKMDVHTGLPVLRRN